MKKFFTVFFVAILTLLIIAAAVPFLLPREVIKENIKNEARYYTGRELDFTDMKLMFWPDMGVKLEGVTFANFEGAKNAKMVAVDKIDVAVAVKPLLSKQLVLKKLVLENPTVNLEFVDDKTGSLDFVGKIKGQQQAATDAKDAKPVTAKDGMFHDMKIELGKIYLQNGQISVINKGANYALSAMNVELSLPKADGNLEVKGSAVYLDKQVNLSLALDKPFDFALGQVSPSIASLSTSDARINVRGDLAKALDKISVDVDADVSSLPEFVKWATNNKDASTSGFKRLKVTSVVKTSTKSVTLTKASIDADDLNINGDVDVDFSGKPSIFARVKTGELNIDKLIKKSKGEDKGTYEVKADELTPEGRAKLAAEDDKAAKQAAAEAAFNLAGLKKFNADLTVTTDGLILGGIKIGTGDVKFNLTDGELAIKANDASAFNGKISTNVKVKASDVPSFSADFDLNGADGKEILSKLAGFSKLDGKVKGNFSVQSSGANADKVIANLKGQGSLSFKDGNLQGIDMLSIANNLKNYSSGVDAGSGTTKFADLSGTFKILNGVISNDDLKMTSDSVNATGKGTIDLVKKNVNFYLTPVLTSKSDKVEGKEANIAVPFYVEGSFEKIKFKPDMKAVALKALQDPKEAKQQLKNLKDNIKEKIDSMKSGAKSTTATTSTTTENQAATNATSTDATSEQPNELEKLKQDPGKYIGNIFSTVINSVKDSAVEKKPNE